MSLIRKSLATLIILLFAMAADAQVSGTRFNVARSPNGPGAIATIFLHSSIGVGMVPPGQWITVDVTSLHSPLPDGTLAIDLGGFLIITNGATQGTANITIALRRFGDTQVTCGSYIGQTISVNPPANNGSRQLMNAWVSLSNNKFEWCWQRGIMGRSWPTGTLQAWPTDPAFAINLNIEAYLTP